MQNNLSAVMRKQISDYKEEPTITTAPTNTTTPVFSLRLAGILMSRGFNLLGMSQNTQRTDKNVFYFKDTPQLHEAIQQYVDERKQAVG